MQDTYTIRSPVPTFMQSVDVQIDGAGAVFLCGQSKSGLPNGGSYVAMVDAGGGSAHVVLAPGVDAYGPGRLQVINGQLYLIAMNQAQDTIRAWRVKEWQPYQATQPMPAGTVTVPLADMQQIASIAMRNIK